MSLKELSSKKRSIISVENIIFILFSILLTYPLFLRGLYFEEELLPTLVFCFVIITLWEVYNIKNSSYKLIKTPIDILALGTVFMYFISIFYGVNKRTAIIEFSKYFAFFSIFILSRDILKENKRKNIFLNIILLGAFIVSIVGIGSSIGTWEYTGAFEGGRISSTFQYPNTLASYVGALYFLSMGLMVNQDKKIYKGVYGILLGTFIFTLILTYSRGMWLLFPIIFLFYFIFVPKERKFETFLYSIASVIVAIPFAFLFTRAIEKGSNIKLWTYYIIAAVGTGVLVCIISLIDEKLRKVSVKKLLVFLVILIVILALGVVYVFNATTSLTMENNTGEEKWDTIVRSVEKVLPNSHYELGIKYSAKNEKEQSLAGRVVVYSVDKEGEYKELAAETIVESGEDKIVLPFETDEDAIGVKVYFQNAYPETSITFLNATMLDVANKDLDTQIPLKYKYIPESIIRRIDSINIGENSAQARILFYKDAFNVIKDYPIFGAGGGGWVTLYQKYQSYPYWTTQAHNYFLQLWIEVGILGLGVFIGLVALLLIYGLKKYKTSQSTEEKIMIVSLSTIILSICAHAFMDFDLSLSAFTFVLWAIMGILNSIVQDTEFNVVNVKKKHTSKIINSKAVLVVSILVSLTLITTSISFSVGTSYAEKSSKEKDNLDSAIVYLEKANKLDKFNPDYKIDLANMYMNKLEKTGEDEYISKAKSLVDEYIKLGKHSPLINAMGSSFYMGIGLVDEGLDLIERSVELQPMITKTYAQKCDAYLAVFNYYFFQKQEYDRARETLGKALEVKDQIKDVNSRALRPLDENIDLVYKIGQIQFYYDNFDELNNIFSQGYKLDLAYYFDLDTNDDGNIDMLYTWSTEGGNAKYEPMEEDNEGFIRLTNDGENYGIVYPYGLKLEPNTEYLIRFKARGTVEDNKFHFYVIDNSAENSNQGGIENIKLTNDWQTYEVEITTDSDIVPGTQFLDFNHGGSDNGYIDLKEAAIFKK